MRKFVNVEKYVSKVLDLKERLQQKLTAKLQAKRSEIEQRVKLYAANYVGDLLRQEIISQGKNPDAKPQPKTPEPTVADAIRRDRPRFHTPFVPSWVRESFTDPRKHVVRNPLPKPPLHPLLDDSIKPIELTVEESVEILNDDISDDRVNEILGRHINSDGTIKASSLMVAEEKSEEKRTNAIQDLRQAIANIELEMKFDDEDKSVQVASGSRPVATAKKVARPAKVLYGKKKPKATKSKKPVKVKKFNKPVFRRVED